MAGLDYAGLLTGISPQSAKIDPFSLPTAGQQRMAFGAQQAQGVQRAGEGLFKLQSGSPQEIAKTELYKLDRADPQYEQKFIKLLSIADPAKAAEVQQKRQDQTKSTSDATAVAAALPPQYSKLADAIRAQVPGAVQAGLKILGEVPDAPTVEQASLVDTKTGKTVEGVELRNGIPYKQGTDTRLTPEQLEGKAISKTFVRPPTPLVSTVQTPQQKVEENNLLRQAKYVETTEPLAQKALKDKQASTAILTEVGKGINTGALSNFIANQSANLQGVFEAAGVDYPASFSKPIEDQSVLKILQNEAIIPMMESQGKGFTDKDLEYQTKVLPGFTQPWQYNEAAATIKLHTAVNQIEENTFANQRSYLAEVTPLDHTTLWDDYLTKLPRSKTVQAERNGVKYKKMEVVQDGANLSQYWVKDKPRGFTLVTGEGNKDVTWADINKTAEANNKSVREFLAAYENQGLIIKGIY